MPQRHNQGQQHNKGSLNVMHSVLAGVAAIKLLYSNQHNSTRQITSKVKGLNENKDEDAHE